MLCSLRSALRLLGVLVFIPSLAICQVAQPAPTLNRHATKVQKTLASYPPASIVMVVMNDNTTRLGALGELADSSFELTRRNGEVVRLSYADVHKVQQADRQNANQAVFHHHSRWITGVAILGIIGVPIILVACCDR